MTRLACLLILCGTAAFAATDKAESQSKFVADFLKHWENAKQLAVAVAEAMPAPDYGFKPNPDEMTFGEQMVHLAESTEGYCAFVADKKSDFRAPTPVAPESAAKAVGASFDYCAAVIGTLTDAQLDQFHGEGKGRFDTREVLFGLLVHMAHHRGQAEVYLRAKGIKPPEYKW
jgi:uncharacterized damage-inducible protein DinB